MVAVGLTPRTETCNCPYWADPEEHSYECDLWDNDEFAAGFLHWDTKQWKLVDRYNRQSVDDETDWAALNDDDRAELEAIFDRMEAEDGKSKGADVIPLAPATVKASAPSTTTTTKHNTYYKCRHYQQEFTLPDGTLIYPSSHHWRDDKDHKDEPIPDLGIYLAGSWQPDTIAFHVGCPDYGVPTAEPWQVIHVARQGVDLARQGKLVEVGCIGGHGRTGLMLAIMVMLTQETPDAIDAQQYVWDNYCKEAIESKKQMWYIEGIEAELAGEEWPEMPQPRRCAKNDCNTTLGDWTDETLCYKHRPNTAKKSLPTVGGVILSNDNEWVQCGWPGCLTEYNKVWHDKYCHCHRNKDDEAYQLALKLFIDQCVSEEEVDPQPLYTCPTCHLEVHNKTKHEEWHASREATSAQDGGKCPRCQVLIWNQQIHDQHCKAKEQAA